MNDNNARSENQENDHSYPVEKDHDGKPTYARGEKRPWWFLLAIPFLVLMVFLKKHAKNVCWKSVFLCVLLFEFTLLFIEHNSIMLGHWMYNKNKLLGPEIWGIPVEEPLIYYLFPPIMVILIFHIVVNRIDKKKV